MDLDGEIPNMSRARRAPCLENPEKLQELATRKNHGILMGRHTVHESFDSSLVTEKMNDKITSFAIGT